MRPATVLAPRGREQGGVADVGAAAPVAGDLPQRREARVPPIRRDADAVDPRAADDRHAPAALGARAQHREGVVVDEDPLGPGPRLESFAQLALLAREVDT